MSRKSIKHVRHHAKKHAQAHAHLKDLLSKGLPSEKIWGLFIITLMAALSLSLILFNWQSLVDLFETSEEADAPSVVSPVALEPINGAVDAILINQALEQQILKERQKDLSEVNTEAALLGIETATVFFEKYDEEQSQKQSALQNSLFLNNELMKGQQLSGGQNQSADIVLKSLLTNYYLMEKTVPISSALEMDSQILAKLNNTLSVDLFAYLNQSNDRADSLDNYVQLLENLMDTAQNRSAELQSQITFLEKNLDAQERSITLMEEEFFVDLEGFEGMEADETLQEFIALGQEQTEVKAKIGAYQTIKDYYDYFLPRLDTLITAIKANRDPLIAGVRVVEIEDMTLDLIIREK